MRKVCYHSEWLESHDSCKPDGRCCVYLIPTERVVCWHTYYQSECDHNPVCKYIDGRNVVIKDRNQKLYRIDGQPLEKTDRHDDMWTCRIRNNPFVLCYSECALIILDVWNKHPNTGCALRVSQLAPAINNFANFLRDKGCLIIHSPSDTRYYDTNNPELDPDTRQARQNALDAFDDKWKRKCYAYLGNRYFPSCFDHLIEYKTEWPAEKNNFTGKPTKQNSAIKIQANDAISGDIFNSLITKVDSYGEMLALTKNRPNLIYVGVHTNRCILGRPNAMRTMAKSGKSLWIVRDLTDVATGGSISGLTEYAAHVDGSGDFYRLDTSSYNHFEATDLIVDWIGRNVGAETWTSTYATNEPRFKFYGPFGDDHTRVWPRYY